MTAKAEATLIKTPNRSASHERQILLRAIERRFGKGVQNIDFRILLARAVPTVEPQIRVKLAGRGMEVQGRQMRACFHDVRRSASIEDAWLYVSEEVVAIGKTLTGVSHCRALWKIHLVVSSSDLVHIGRRLVAQSVLVIAINRSKCVVVCPM